MKVIENGPGLLSDQAINWIRATVDVQLEIINANLSENHKQSEKFAKICDLHASWAAKVKNFEAAEPIQDGLSKEWAAAHIEIEKSEEELRIKKCCSAKLERWNDECKLEPEVTELSNITQLQQVKDMLLHKVRNLLPEKGGLEYGLGAFERVIEWLTTN